MKQQFGECWASYVRDIPSENYLSAGKPRWRRGVSSEHHMPGACTAVGAGPCAKLWAVEAGAGSRWGGAVRRAAPSQGGSASSAVAVLVSVVAASFVVVLLRSVRELELSEEEEDGREFPPFLPVLSSSPILREGGGSVYLREWGMSSCSLLWRRMRAGSKGWVRGEQGAGQAH